MNLEIKSVLARDSSARATDILTVKRMLNRLGHYVPTRGIGMTDFADAALFEALKAFQRQKGAPETGKISPDDDTWQALFEAYNTPPADAEAYIWVTMEDDHVRSAHITRHGKTFLWKDHPWPGEEVNCRCWAEQPPEEDTKPEAPVDQEPGKAGEPWLKIVLDELEEFERDISHPYGDSKGIITVGIGKNIDQEATFLALPWRFGTEDGRPATLTEIKDGYRALANAIAIMKKQAAAQNLTTLAAKANHYMKITNLRLPAETRESMATRDLSVFLQELNKKFPDFNRFPDPAKVALMDMIYNIGGTKFTEAKWPSLFAAIAARDWNRAAAESHRKDVGERRNEKTRANFRQAAESEASNKN